MKILGIETSCDETAAAVVEDGVKVLSNTVFSQIPLHHATGGVVPEVAAREHVVKIMPVVSQTLNEAGMTLDDIDAIAVTQGPGLLSSLVIGMSTASTMAILKDKPLIPVNHIAGHIYANWLDEDPKDPIQFPLIVLTVSGGHNELVLMKSHHSFRLLGETLDDAAGEAFDKVARLLGLGYPGGPHISRKAETGNPKRYPLPRVYLQKDSFNFSFSGLKTAVLNLVKEEHSREGALSDEFIADCSASFQENVVQILSDKLLAAAEKYRVKEVHLAGGVSANRRLRKVTEEKISNKYYFDHKGKNLHLALPPVLRYAKDISLCTDNAAMIAAAAYFQYKTLPNKRMPQGNSLADPNLRMYHNPR